MKYLIEHSIQGACLMLFDGTPYIIILYCNYTVSIKQKLSKNINFVLCICKLLFIVKINLGDIYAFC